jgi:hypothetical protein
VRHADSGAGVKVKTYRRSRSGRAFPQRPLGSETFWPEWLTGNRTSEGEDMAFARDGLRYVAFPVAPGRSGRAVLGRIHPAGAAAKT